MKADDGLRLALAHYQQDRLNDARHVLRGVLRAAPQHTGALNVLAAVEARDGHHSTAVELLERSLAGDAGNWRTLSNLGLSLRELGRFDEALACLARAQALKPDYPIARYNEGVVLRAMQRWSDALAAFEHALALQPAFPEALSNRGDVLTELGRLDEAVRSYERALALRPAFVEAHINRAHALRELGRFDAALAGYDRASALAPGATDAEWNASLVNLLLGRYEQGFRLHEHRWRTSALGLRRREFAAPLWLGDAPLEGRTILLHSEQGYGDAIQMVRYVPPMQARGARIVLEVPAGLVTLLTEQFRTVAVAASGAPLPPFDLHCPLMSLPLALGTRLDTVPSRVPYLAVGPAAIRTWRERLGSRQRLRVGLAWAGNPFPPHRSIPLPQVLRHLGDLPVDLVSLHKDVPAADRDAITDGAHLAHFGDQQRDFADAAAIIESVDLVVSVDTSIAHLAGALGKPVWILLPFVPDWRWMLERTDSPWYPTATLFRQGIRGDWNPVLGAVRARLAAMSADSASGVSGRRDGTRDAPCR